MRSNAKTNARPIRELFRHRGHIYVHCSSAPVWNMFLSDLAEQGFSFPAGAIQDAPSFRDIIAVNRDCTASFCGFASHVRCGSLANPVYVKEDSSRNCTRVDYARFISGAEDYVIRGPQDSFECAEGQPLPAGSYYVWD